MSGDVLDVMVPGPPIPKGRPRVAGGQGYTPTRTRRAERDLGWWLRMAMGPRPPVTAPLGVQLRFVEARRRGDIDNLIKTVLDAGQGIVWVNDRQVVALYARVDTGADPRTEVRVWTV